MPFSVSGALQYQYRSGKDPRDTARAIGQMMEAAGSVALTVVKYHDKTAETMIKKTDTTKASELPKPTTPATAPRIAAPAKPPLR